MHALLLSDVFRVDSVSGLPSMLVGGGMGLVNNLAFSVSLTNVAPFDIPAGARHLPNYDFLVSTLKLRFHLYVMRI